MGWRKSRSFSDGLALLWFQTSNFTDGQAQTAFENRQRTSSMAFSQAPKRQLVGRSRGVSIDRRVGSLKAQL
jgi:hypothetical protein